MNQYTGFAKIYDRMMNEAPVYEWVQLLNLEFPNLKDWGILDLACGTGDILNEDLFSYLWAFGIDVSEDMLAEASVKSQMARRKVQFLSQDMRDFHLPRPVQLVISTCDSVNYLLTRTDLQLTFAAVERNLSNLGWFCFDLLGPRRLDKLRDGIWHDIQEDSAVLFESEVTADGAITHQIHGFITEANGMYRRFEEVHDQQYYGIGDVQSLLERTGFQVKRVIGDFGHTLPNVADRVIVMAQRA